MKFEVTSAPPSQAEILKGRRIDNIREACLIAGTVLFFCSILAALVSSNARFMALTVVSILFMGFYTCSSSNYCEDLPADKCGEMLELCEKTPEGRQYRAAVLKLGRKFVEAEVEMMRLWVKQIAQRRSCRQLYGIEDGHRQADAKTVAQQA